MERYFELSFKEVKWTFVQYGEGEPAYPNRTLIDIPLTSCSADRFNNQTDQTDIIALKEEGYVCPEKRNFDLLGTITSKERSFLKLQITPCNNNTLQKQYPGRNISCATIDEIRYMTKNVFLMLITMNQYFDQTVYEGSPVKTEIKTYYYNFKLDQAYVQDIYYG